MPNNQALALIRQHKFEDALPLLAADLKAHPQDPYTAYYLAYAFVGAKDHAPALALLTSLLDAHPDLTDARVLLGLARIRASDFPGATNAYQAVLTKDPQHPAALLGLGMIHYWSHEYPLAEDYLDRALRRNPEARDALVFKADIRFSEGEISEAMNLLKEARRVRRPALPEVDDLELNDRLARYQAQLEPLRLARGGLPPLPGWVMGVMAASFTLTLLSLIAIPGEWQGLRAYHDGRDRLAAGDYPGCAVSMSVAVSNVSDSPKAWAYAAYCHLLDKDIRAGLAEWETAQALEPSIQLDSQADQLALLAKVRAAHLQPKVGAH
ncbi:MAG TPA: tetratricopeptide repeat protein [Candidatus Eisenbacteria bacterium]|nr:tetratricopeptide repeat protein [Candidatus Eisenbacteria bacterium]